MSKVSRFLLPTAALALALGLAPSAAKAAHELSATAEHAEETAAKFKDRLDSELDKLVIDGFDEEERLEEQAEQLRARLDELHDEIQDADDDEARQEVQEVLKLAEPINDAMGEYAFSSSLKRMWLEVSSDLNQMASDLGLPTLVVIVVQ